MLWKKTKVVFNSAVTVGGMTETKLQWREEAHAVLANLSKQSHNSFITVRVHKGFPCLLYSRQLALLSLSPSSSLSPLLARSGSHPSSVSVPSFYHSGAFCLDLSVAPLCHLYSFVLFIPGLISLSSVSQWQKVYFIPLLPLFLSVFLCVYASSFLSFSLLYLSWLWQCVGSGGRYWSDLFL